MLNYEKFESALNNAVSGQNRMGCSEANYDAHYLIVGAFTKNLSFENDKEFDALKNKVDEITNQFTEFTGINGFHIDSRFNEDFIRKEFGNYFSRECYLKIYNELNSKCISETLNKSIVLFNELSKARFDLKEYCNFKQIELFKENTKNITDKEFELMEKIADYASEVFY